MSKASNQRRTQRSRARAKAGKPVRYAVFKGSRTRVGLWRTAAETRKLLGLPANYPIPAHICKLPPDALQAMVAANTMRMLNRHKIEDAAFSDAEPVEAPADAPQAEAAPV